MSTSGEGAVGESDVDVEVSASVIELGEELFNTRSVRRIQLRKTRGSGALSGLHECEIFSNHWWQQEPDLVMRTIKERHQRCS